MSDGISQARYVVVGGGVCGVSCCQTLSSVENSVVTLVAASGLLKGVANVVRLSRRLDTFDVVDQPIDEVEGPNTRVIAGEAHAIDAKTQTLMLKDGQKIQYDKLCICTGARPNVISKHPRVLSLRDSDSVRVLKERIASSKRVMVVGNGGIALELVHEITRCQVIWAVKDGHIGNAFFDQDAANFLLPALADRTKVVETSDTDAGSLSCSSSGTENSEAKPNQDCSGNSRVEGGEAASEGLQGSALGSQWLSGILNTERGMREAGLGGHLAGAGSDSTILLERYTSVARIDAGGEGDEWPVTVTLKNGHVYGCDYIISATGVVPNAELVDDCPAIRRKDDSAILVNQRMETSVEGIYAAGDVCWVVKEDDSMEQNPDLWFQMRLWSQARQQGIWAAQCMSGQNSFNPSPLDLFAHATKFLGLKGCSTQGGKTQVYQRVTTGKVRYAQISGMLPLAYQINFSYLTADSFLMISEYVRVTLFDGRMVGALLLGDTDLEETFENLILNGLDLSSFGAGLLDPNIDLEDYFD